VSDCFSLREEGFENINPNFCVFEFFFSILKKKTLRACAHTTQRLQMEHVIACKTCKTRIGPFFKIYEELCKRGIPEAQILERMGIENICCRTEFLSSVSIAHDRIKNWTSGLPSKT